MNLGDLPLAQAPAVTAAQMAEIDRVAVDEYGMSIEMLMENASRTVARGARVLLGGRVDGRRIVALAGHGNNGGDALGAARHLANWGARARAIVAGSADALHGLPRRQHDLLAALGIEPESVDASLDADLILDGLLGYSVSGAPRRDVARLIERANASGVPVLAIDLPSGLHPDAGEPLGATIRALVTVTLALPKVGVLRPEAAPFVGQLLLADIAIPPAAYDRFGIDARGVFAEGELVIVAT